MNLRPNIKTAHSVCPHDCPSTCALEVELLDAQTIGRIRGAKDNPYTAGVICEKVGRYAERIHHPDRLTQPLKRKGPRGSGEWQQLSWDDALDEVAAAMLKAEDKYGPEAVWPYYYAGTMGLLMRDGIHRLRHVKKYSGLLDTFCVALSNSGYTAGTGSLSGTSSSEIQKADLVVLWGTNPVNTQVNVMSHAAAARKSRGAKIAVVDIYETGTVKKADLGLVIRPGTDAALACAVMHVAFRDDYADRAYMQQFTDDPAGLEAHLKTRTPEWAAAITGLGVAEIEAFAKLIGETKATYFRLGYGFSRSRNGAVNMHAVTCIPTVMGHWQYEGGGALHSNSGIYKWNKTLIEGSDAFDPSVRMLDQCRIGPVLCNDPYDLQGGPPVTVLFTQNTNPVSVAPHQNAVKQGLARDDLFICVHEQFMTETAALADIVLPATMFLEHDDVYQGSGHQYIQLGLKLVEAPGECRNNHDVLCGLASRVGAEHQGFNMTEREIIDWTLKHSGRPPIDEVETEKWVDVQPDFETAHYLKGFGHADGKFRFKPDWKASRQRPHVGPMGPVDDMPEFPDYWEVIRVPDAQHPFRLATSPARTFLNSTFNETPTSTAREGRPELLMHPDDMAANGFADGQKIKVGNEQGAVTLHLRAHDALKAGVVISEGIWPNTAFEDGCGINTLVGADQPAPVGGGTFHDNHVWVRAV
jgi:anaerobic selenocysteine-containing dehydrogenase